MKFHCEPHYALHIPTFSVYLSLSESFLFPSLSSISIGFPAKYIELCRVNQRMMEIAQGMRKTKTKSALDIIRLLWILLFRSVRWHVLCIVVFWMKWRESIYWELNWNLSSYIIHTFECVSTGVWKRIFHTIDMNMGFVRWICHQTFRMKNRVLWDMITLIAIEKTVKSLILWFSSLVLNRWPFFIFVRRHRLHRRSKFPKNLKIP